MDQEHDDKEWKRIMGELYPPYQHPHPEVFISKVMSRVEKESTQGFPGWLRWSWRIPALALGAVLGFFLIIMQPNANPVSTEILLLGDSSSTSTQTDELLELSVEDL